MMESSEFLVSTPFYNVLSYTLGIWLNRFAIAALFLVPKD
jgi:hypothetical protein